MRTVRIRGQGEDSFQVIYSPFVYTKLDLQQTLKNSFQHKLEKVESLKCPVKQTVPNIKLFKFQDLERLLVKP